MTGANPKPRCRKCKLRVQVNRDGRITHMATVAGIIAAQHHNADPGMARIPGQGWVPLPEVAPWDR